MGTPPLSVVMPVHNALPFLDASISSILDQTVGQKYVGQHSLEGFCILKSANGDEVRAEDLHLLALPEK